MKDYLFIFPALYFLVAGFVVAEETGAGAFSRACAVAGDGAATRTVTGADRKWLFLKSELEHLGTGAFWTKDWKDVSKSGTDPVPVLLALNEKLSALGVKFIYVPVPAKAAIYPEKFTTGVNMKGKLPAEGAVTPVAPFLEKLSSGGIAVIDIEPVLRANRVSGGERSYCKTDSHPTPWTCELIAKHVAELLSEEQWAKQSAKASMLHFVKGEPEARVIKGDLIPEAKRDAWDAEEVVVRKAGVKQGDAIRTVLPDDESSPVILLGDSHTLIFHEGGDMLMSGAGVPDHLQAALGFRVYLAASRGSSSQAQRQIYKGADFWKGKKALVWVSSVREFTRERKWLKLPRLPK